MTANKYASQPITFNGNNIDDSIVGRGFVGGARRITPRNVDSLPLSLETKADQLFDEGITGKSSTISIRNLLNMHRYENAFLKSNDIKETDEQNQQKHRNYDRNIARSNFNIYFPDFLSKSSFRSKIFSQHISDQDFIKEIYDIGDNNFLNIPMADSLSDIFNDIVDI